jgi:hypothetical protein
MTPGSLRVPTMVCVLPDPVCPYANTVPLMPSIADSTIGRTVSEYTEQVSALPWNRGLHSSTFQLNLSRF